MTDLEDRLCTAEFPGDDMFVGQLCERERNHTGAHEHLADIAGTRFTRRLTWPAVGVDSRETQT